ncbi:hypothetical protein BT69DRAFT_375528 [Atractiella rhizophila]|nr:hypothetical protein BT69DRAFT_375528 [Atractiella rhizophila]
MNPYLSNQLSNAIALPIIALNALAVHDAITSARAYYKLNPPAVEAKKEEQTPKRRTRRLVSFVLCMIVFISLEIYAGWNADAETIDFVGAWFNGVFTFMGLTTVSLSFSFCGRVVCAFHTAKRRETLLS